MVAREDSDDRGVAGRDHHDRCAEIIMIGGQVKGQVLTAHVLEQRLRGRVEVHPRPVHALRSRVGCANVHAVSIRVWISARTS
jgi:hypothetical protein